MKKTIKKSGDEFNTPVRQNGKIVGYAVAKYAKNVQSLLDKNAAKREPKHSKAHEKGESKAMKLKEKKMYKKS